jgi:hypothetical protein
MAIDWDAVVLAPCMSPDVFGEDADQRPTYTPQATGVGFPIDGVFDRPFHAATLEADGDAAFATRKPSLGVRLAQFPADPVKGDKVYVPSVPQTYLVSDVHPDGKGWALLDLMISA